MVEIIRIQVQELRSQVGKETQFSVSIKK